ncbi:maltose O-acetyltransferase/hypothetical protein [Rathayibacter oskolensis]|uniref:Maltose O-acetyltransferase n=1 Tax=Rathayibacter oskolensis TaxID=1891671 RepID=A0A1X7NAQ5_9MICO|nr:DapH/DapD/GlmU-related protein [Rathayibacter oskolensis]SMH34661.1 maltose O-acetyltransferase/hypothetical protein [Rathayibacter oskolensis]
MSIASKVRKELWIISRDVVLNRVAASSLIPISFRWRVLRLLGLDVEKSRLCAGIWIGSRDISIGAGSFVNYRCIFNSAGGIRIGRNCDIAMDASFITSSHAPGDFRRRAGAATTAPIVVGDGSWIGARAIILPGVTIGRGVVIAAGAVVTEDCEDDSVWGGVPARRLKSLSGSSQPDRSP